MKEPLDMSVLIPACLHSPSVCMHSTYFAYRIQSWVVIEMSSSYIYLMYLFLHYFYATSQWPVWESKCQSWGMNRIAHLHPPTSTIKKSEWYWLWQREEQCAALSMQVHASHLIPGERWHFCPNFLSSLELCRVLWDSIMSSRKTQGKHLSVSIINKQQHQIVVIMHHSRLKNGKKKIYFFNQYITGIQTSAKRGRARSRAVSSWTVSISSRPKGTSPRSQWLCWLWL